LRDCGPGRAGCEASTARASPPSLGAECTTVRSFGPKMGKPQYATRGRRPLTDHFMDATHQRRPGRHRSHTYAHGSTAWRGPLGASAGGGQPSGLPPFLPGLGRGAPPDQEACACWDGVGAGSQPAPGDGRATLSGGPRRAVKSPGPKAGLMSDSERRVGARASRRKDASTPLTRGFD